MANGTTPRKMNYKKRRLRVTELYLQGWTQVKIAEEVGVTQGMVSKDLAAIREEWLQASIENIDEAKARELARIDNLEREYWEAWYRSCEDAETVVKKAVETDKGQRKEATQTAKGQAGDPRFLAGIQWCIQQRCKILGIEAAAKLDLTSKGELLQGPTIVLPAVLNEESETDV